MEVSLIFVYYSEAKKKIKVLSLNEAKEQNDTLLESGWSHTATLDARKWLEYLFNEAEAEDVIADIRKLSTSTKRSKVVV